MIKPKIILWDLETLQIPSAAMKHWPSLSQYPGLTLRANLNSIICFGYKELGSKKAKIVNAWDFNNWNEDKNDDFLVVQKAYEVLHDADGIVTHNGTRFDLKFLNSRLVHHGLTPLPKIPHIDTCRVAKSNLFLINNRLNTVAAELGCDLKMENGGWDLWVQVQQGNPKAMKTMSAYCKQDVQVLEQVFLRLRPFANNIPNYNQFTGNGEELLCPSCGSANIYKNGTRRSKTQVYQRYLCQDCGSTSRSDKDDLNLRSY